MLQPKQVNPSMAVQVTQPALHAKRDQAGLRHPEPDPMQLLPAMTILPIHLNACTWHCAWWVCMCNQVPSQVCQHHAQPRLPCSPIEGQAFAQLVSQDEGTDGEQSGPALLPVLLLCRRVAPQKGSLLRSLSPCCWHVPPAGGSCCASGCSDGSVGVLVRQALSKRAVANCRVNLGARSSGRTGSCRLPARAALPQDSS